MGCASSSRRARRPSPPRGRSCAHQSRSGVSTATRCSVSTLIPTSLRVRHCCTPAESKHAQRRPCSPRPSLRPLHPQCGVWGRGSMTTSRSSTTRRPTRLRAPSPLQPPSLPRRAAAGRRTPLPTSPSICLCASMSRRAPSTSCCAPSSRCCTRWWRCTASSPRGRAQACIHASGCSVCSRSTYTMCARAVSP